MDAYVYFMQAKMTGLIKIGRAVDVTKRMKTLQHGSPDSLALLGVVSERAFTEKAIHTTFATERMHGEWFSPSPALVRFISDHARQLPAKSKKEVPSLVARTPGALGAIIKGHRIAANITQQDLADQVGVSRQWVVEVERGKPRAEIGLVLQTLDVLGVALNARW